MKGAPAVRPRIFGGHAGVVCAVSSRRGPGLGMNMSFSVGDDPAKVTANREEVFTTLGISADRLASPVQVHGRTVRAVSAPGTFESCDGLVTQERDLFLSVSVADCLPLFLFDPAGGAVAAVHAGWRGSRSGIAAAAVEVMKREFGSRSEDILAFIGPGAGACCYEVGEEVAAEFDDRFLQRPGPARPRLDLKGFTCGQLSSAGVPPANVEVSGLCTICSPDSCHSFRRDGAGSGRMMGLIGLRSASETDSPVSSRGLLW